MSSAFIVSLFRDPRSACKELMASRDFLHHLARGLTAAEADMLVTREHGPFGADWHLRLLAACAAAPHLRDPRSHEASVLYLVGKARESVPGSHSQPGPPADVDGGSGAILLPSGTGTPRPAPRGEWESDLRRALVSAPDQLAPDQLAVVFQPVFSLAEGKITGAEALARWRHPTRGEVPPDVFIPVAEETGLIGAIGAHVLSVACTVAAGWPDDQTVAVNASALELADDGYAGRVAAALSASGLAPARLEIEITETAAIAATGASARTLAALRACGVRLAIDDFGTGFSSFSRLRQIAADRIKIDRSFIANIARNATDRAIVKAVVDMAHAAGLQTTVEGVETDEQSQWLRAAGCDNVQGFLFARPMPREAIDLMMRAGGNIGRRAANGPGEA